MNYHLNNSRSLFSENGTLQLTKALWKVGSRNTEEWERITHNFSENFSCLMSQDPRTRSELALALHISKPTMNRWKEGGVKPQYQKLLDVAECFSVTPEALIANPGKVTYQIACEGNHQITFDELLGNIAQERGHNRMTGTR